MGKKSFALGRGLSDILKDHDANKNLSAAAPQGETSNDQKVVEIQLDLIDPNPFQPRKVFNEDELAELANTIKTHGLLQPISVRSVNGRYQIISGERRTRASRLAGLKTIKAQIEISSREFNGKWYTDVRVWRFDPVGAVQAPAASTQPAQPAQQPMVHQTPPQATASTPEYFAPAEDSTVDLPF